MGDQDASETPEAVLRRSNPNAGGPQGAAGGMGVSSERTGPTGPGQHGTDGLRHTGATESPDDAPPEQSPGGPEENPEGIEPKAGYPSTDPRSED